MKNETRYNVIFIIVLLSFVLPGGVMLFRKKLAPTVRPGYVPEQAPRAIAYMSPLEMPPGAVRVEPAETRKWIESLVRERAGEGAIRPRSPDGLPVISHSRTFEVAAVRGGDVWVIVWSGEASKWENPVEVVESATLDVPSLVRDELGENWVLKPPKTLVWEHLRSADPRAPLGGLRMVTGDSVNFVPSFTNSVSASN